MVTNFLQLAARYGRWVLVAGLLIGTFFPALAALLRDHIWWMIAGLLLSSCIRIGYHEAIGALSWVKTHVILALGLQLVWPLFLVAVFSFSGFSGVLASSLLLMAIAAPIAGSPNLAIMMESDGAPSLRQLVVGTAVLPLTCLPILFFIPGMGEVATVAAGAAWLIAIIFGAAITGFVLRSTLIPNNDEQKLKAVDGFSAILMAIVVVGLMTEVGNTLYTEPSRLWAMLLFACCANFGCQFLFSGLLATGKFRSYAVTSGIAGGNRNIALFIAALPVSVTEPLMLFVGCYQIPMYLTPLVMNRYYRKFAGS